ncbi:hypothetical protein TNCV_4535421 [Trichonephila clavipes]|nr:hypothetical protein TNCV_4535421 [Trichonephila clavipes]
MGLQPREQKTSDQPTTSPSRYELSSLVYADKPQTLDHLEENIRRVIADIRPQMLEKVIENLTSRLDYIRASRGSPMPEIIFKMYAKKNYLETIHVHVFYNSYAKHFASFCNHNTPDDMYLLVYMAVFSMNTGLDIDSFMLVTTTTWLLWLHPFFSSTWKRSSLVSSS